MNEDWILWFIQLMSFIVIMYMVIVAVTYIALFLIAGPRIRKERKLNRNEYIEEIAMNKDTFPVSVLVPAYNEEVGVASTVRSMLGLNYPQFEVVVIDDGSKDLTSEKVIQEFHKKEIDLAIRKYFKTQ